MQDLPRMLISERAGNLSKVLPSRNLFRMPLKILTRKAGLKTMDKQRSWHKTIKKITTSYRCSKIIKQLKRSIISVKHL